MNGLIQEFDGGFLLELKAVAHGVAGVDEQADLEGKIGFGVEATNLLGSFVVVDDVEIGLLEISNASTLLVGYGEDDVDLVGACLDRRQGLISGAGRVGRFLIRRGRLCLRLRGGRVCLRGRILS